MLSDLRTDSGWPLHAAPLRVYSGTQPSPFPDDAGLCIEVRLALLRTCPTLACSVEVMARDGVVRLRGSVGSERVLVRMYKAARSVPGIHWICNDVIVARPL